MRELSQEEKDRYVRAFGNLCLMMRQKVVGSRYYMFPDHLNDGYVHSFADHCWPDDLASWIERKFFEDEQD